MATSGSTNFNQTRNEIIEMAMFHLTASGAEDTVQSFDMEVASKILNQIIKNLQLDILPQWAETEGTLLLVNNQAEYSIGGTSSSKGSRTVNETTLSSSAVISATSIVVSSASNIAISDVIGVVTNSNTISWTTVSNKVGSTITLATGLSAAAASGKYVYSYTTVIDKPVDILQIRLRTGSASSPSDRELTEIGSSEYFAISNKTKAGKPTQFYYKQQLNTTTLYLYPVPDSVTYRLKFTYLRSLEDMDSSTDNLDFPQQWILPISLLLAIFLAPGYGVTEAELSGLKNNFTSTYSTAKKFDIGTTKIFLGPDLSGYYKK